MEDLPCYVGEFVGTYLLVFAAGCNLIVGTPVWAPISIAATLVVLVYALSSVSGAHLNPAITLAAGILGKMPWKKVGVYSLMQIVGGTLGALTYTLCFWKELPLQSASNYNWLQVGLAEALYTCMLCFVVLNVAMAGRDTHNHHYGLAIGFVIVAAGYSIGHVSGGILNPALTLGMDIMSKSYSFKWPFLYVLFELIGACMAAGLFKACRPEDDYRLEGYSGMGGNYVGLEPKMSARLAAEFLGTFFIVLTIGLNVLGESVQPMLSIGTSVMCMTCALRNISGGLFNPASTLAIFSGTYNILTGRSAGLYMLVQCLGGITGALFYAMIEHGHTFPLEPGKDFGWLHAAVAETIFTAVLAFVVLSTSTGHGEHLNEYAGVAIGFTAIGGGIAVGIISGGVLNPASSVAISTIHLPRGGIRQFWHGCFYVLFEIAGGGIAAALFMVMHPSLSKAQKVTLP